MSRVQDCIPAIDSGIPSTSQHKVRSTLKIATWNVNSLKVRLPHLQDWLAAQSPDVVCLQEVTPDPRNVRLPDEL